MTKKQFSMVLETPRLLIRPADPNSAGAVNDAVRKSQPMLAQWLPWADHEPDLEDTRAYLLQSRERFAMGEDCGLYLWSKVTNEFVGGSELNPRSSDSRRREIGYWVRDGQTGQGYAVEAV